jgi:hypothetical protein
VALLDNRSAEHLIAVNVIDFDDGFSFDAFVLSLAEGDVPPVQGAIQLEQSAERESAAFRSEAR